MGRRPRRAPHRAIRTDHMTLVDTSAWVHFLRATGRAAHRHVRDLVESTDRVHTTDVVVMEVLAGEDDEAHVRQLHALLSRCEFVPVAGLGDYEQAGSLYRRCRTPATRSVPSAIASSPPSPSAPDCRCCTPIATSMCSARGPGAPRGHTSLSASRAASDRLPHRRERRGVGEVEVGDVSDRHPGGQRPAHASMRLAAPAPHDLHAEQATRPPLDDDAHRHRRGVRDVPGRRRSRSRCRRRRNPASTGPRWSPVSAISAVTSG